MTKFCTFWYRDHKENQNENAENKKKKKHYVCIALFALKRNFLKAFVNIVERNVSFGSHIGRK